MRDSTSLPTIADNQSQHLLPRPPPSSFPSQLSVDLAPAAAAPAPAPDHLEVVVAAEAAAVEQLDLPAQPGSKEPIRAGTTLATVAAAAANGARKLVHRLTLAGPMGEKPAASEVADVHLLPLTLAHSPPTSPPSSLPAEMVPTKTVLGPDRALERDVGVMSQRSGTSPPSAAVVGEKSCTGAEVPAVTAIAEALAEQQLGSWTAAVVQPSNESGGSCLPSPLPEPHQPLPPNENSVGGGSGSKDSCYGSNGGGSSSSGNGGGIGGCGGGSAAAAATEREFSQQGAEGILLLNTGGAAGPA
jgi:hypothetical protein